MLISVSTPSTSYVRMRTNRQLVKLLRFHPTKTNAIAEISGQEIDLIEVCDRCALRRVNSFFAHSRKISDFDWSSHDENLMVSCAEQDTVCLWDQRDVARPAMEFCHHFGAAQCKLTPQMQYTLLSTHGSDVRIWDTRNTTHPVTDCLAHESSRILSAQWHPHELLFATAANDGYLKIWDLRDRSLPRLVVTGATPAKQSASKILFSPDGEEIATSSVVYTAAGQNVVSIWRNPISETPEALRGEGCDLVVDICWQKQIQKSTKYLFTLTKKHRISRHPVAYELSNEMRDEMATPIAQSAVDEERDRMVAEVPDEVDSALDDASR
ncbi:WD repeat-containing protein 59-like isoform X2 [Aphelenchoides avenae]|nr:WD repeat-containing protein 59-like isoform X2 [Aphelenchus avenae]